MKKMASAILAGLMILGLCACNNKTNESNDTKNSDNETTIGSSAEDPAPSEAAGAQEWGDRTVLWDLDGMTAEQIVNNINNMAKVSPSDPWSSYSDRFVADGASFSKDNNNLGWDNPTSASYIYNCYFYNVSENKTDGTTLIDEKMAGVNVALHIADKNLAREVWNILLQQLDAVEDADGIATYGGWTASIEEQPDKTIILVWLPIQQTP